MGTEVSKISFIVAVGAIVLSAIAIAQMLNLSNQISTQLGTAPSFTQEDTQRITQRLDAFETKLDNISGELHETAEARQSLDVMMTEHNKLVIMAAIHASYRDLDSKLELLSSDLVKNDFQAAEVRISQIKGIITHVIWPDPLTHHVMELKDTIDKLHHAIDEKETEEIEDIAEELPLLREEISKSFYDIWLPSLVARPTKEYTLLTQFVTKPIGFIGKSGEIEGLVNPDIVIRVHETVKITVMNGENVPHDFVSEKLHIHSEHISKKGETTIIVFTPHDTGEFTYYCSVPGHREAGMEGKIIVTE